MTRKASNDRQQISAQEEFVIIIPPNKPSEKMEKGVPNTLNSILYARRKGKPNSLHEAQGVKPYPHELDDLGRLYTPTTIRNQRTNRLTLGTRMHGYIRVLWAG